MSPAPLPPPPWPPSAEAPPGPTRGLWLDKQGRWHHDGEPIRHERLSALLHRCIARDDDGALLVTTGRDRLPIAVEDTPLFVRTVEVGGAGVVMVLSNEGREPLTAAHEVLADAEGVWRVRVQGGRDWARFSRSAMQGLMPWLDEGAGGLALGVPGGPVRVR